MSPSPQINLICVRNDKVSHIMISKEHIDINYYKYYYLRIYLGLILFASKIPLIIAAGDSELLTQLMEAHYKKNKWIYWSMCISVLLTGSIFFLFVFCLKFCTVYIKNIVPLMIHQSCCRVLIIFTMFMSPWFALPPLFTEDNIESRLNTILYIKFLAYIIFIFIGIWNVWYYWNEVYQIKEYDIIYQPNTYKSSIINCYSIPYFTHDIYKSFLWINPIVFRDKNKIEIPNEIGNMIISTNPKFSSIEKQKNVRFYIRKSDINILICELQNEYIEHIRINILESMEIADVKTV